MRNRQRQVKKSRHVPGVRIPSPKPAQPAVAVSVGGGAGPTGNTFQAEEEDPTVSKILDLIDEAKQYIVDNYNPNQPRNRYGEWSKGGAGGPPKPHEVSGGTALGGSTGATLITDEHGNKFVMKTGKASNPHKEAALRNEADSDAAYRAAGLRVPMSHLVESPTGPVKFSRFIPDGKTLGEWEAGASPAEKKALHEKIGRGFVADALLANWDVIGLSKDNIVVKDGKPYRIDNGGALAFRAQGSPKGGSFGTKVGELETMRDPNVNPHSASVFGHLTGDAIHAQIGDVLKSRQKILDAVSDPATRHVLDARFTHLAQLHVSEHYKSKTPAVESQLPPPPPAAAPKLGGLLAPPGSAESKAAIAALDKGGGGVLPLHLATGGGVVDYIKSKAAEHGAKFNALQLEKLAWLNPEGVKDGKYIALVTSTDKNNPAMVAQHEALKKILPPGTQITAKVVNGKSAADFWTGKKPSPAAKATSAPASATPVLTGYSQTHFTHLKTKAAEWTPEQTKKYFDQLTPDTQSDIKIALGLSSEATGTHIAQALGVKHTKPATPPKAAEPKPLSGPAQSFIDSHGGKWQWKHMQKEDKHAVYEHLGLKKNASYVKVSNAKWALKNAGSHAEYLILKKAKDAASAELAKAAGLGGESAPGQLGTSTSKVHPEAGKAPFPVHQAWAGEGKAVAHVTAQGSKHIATLSDEQRASITKYTGSYAASVINPLMRSCPPDFDCIKGSNRQHLENIRSAIDSAPPFKEPITVGRGITLYGKEYDDFVAAHEKHLALGTTYSQPSFTSTSVKSGFGGNIKFVMNARTGLYVKSISSVKGELEVLISPTAQWRVAGLTKPDVPGGQLKVYLEEVLGEQAQA